MTDSALVDTAHILIIGVGPGLGAAVARRFAREGFRLTLVARREEALAALADELRATGTTVDTVVADAADQVSFRELLQPLAAQNAPVIVVYNAGLVQRDTLLTADAEQLAAAYSVDVLGAITAAQVFTPVMAAAGVGTFLTTGGGPALHPDAEHATLSLGKPALRAATALLHDALTPQNVHVAGVIVTGTIAPETEFAPERIAEVYWRLHTQPSAEWRAEAIFDGT
jgi:short-subunit dehydrogenase